MHPLLSNFAATESCKSGGGFFGFPTWYKYLPSIKDKAGNCIPHIQNINDIWLIVAAVIDILLRVAVLAAIGFIVYAGFKYITSQGEPERTKQARNTIWDAIIGLVIAVAATAVVSYVAGRFNG